MEFVKTLKLLEQSSLFSGLMGSLIGAIVGSIIGGFITWLVTSSSLKRQFDYQNTIIEKERYNNERIALSLINMEINHNLSQIKNIKNTMEKYQLENFNLNSDGVKLTFQNEKWMEYSPILISINNLSYFSEIEEFYSGIYFEMINNVTFRDRIEEFVDIGTKILKQLEQTIKDYEGASTK